MFHFVAECLLVDHRGKPASQGIQVLVGTLLDNPAAVQHEYHVAVSHRGQAVGNEDESCVVRSSSMFSWIILSDSVSRALVPSSKIRTRAFL